MSATGQLSLNLISSSPTSLLDTLKGWTCIQQTEYYEALPSSANNEVRCDCKFANDGNASWYSFVKCRRWNDSWTVKTVITWRSSASMILSPNLDLSHQGPTGIPWEHHASHRTEITLHPLPHNSFAKLMLSCSCTFFNRIFSASFSSAVSSFFSSWKKIWTQSKWKLFLLFLDQHMNTE